MHGAWVRFAVDGDPGWSAWDTSHPVRIFGEGDPHTVLGPRDRQLALWEDESARAAAGPAAPAVRPVGSVEDTPASPAAVDASARIATPLSAVRRFRRSGGAGRT